MTENIEFVSNYGDQSTDRGFQFEFYCNRCGSGYRTPFKPWVVGTAATVLDTASSLLGGIFGSAANVTSQVKSATWERAHDEAFKAALEELRPSFVQCPRCATWVCRKNCWNAKRGLCKNCAPDLGVEMAAAQAQRSRDEVWTSAAVADEDKIDADAWRETARATCPSCNAPLAGNVKFCPECGAKIKTSDKCPKCKAKLTPNAKFCPECGAKVA